MLSLFASAVMSVALSVAVLVSGATSLPAKASETTPRGSAAPVVLKDTRQYDEHVSSFGGLTDCRMPRPGEKVEPGDCAVEKARYVRSGELLVRHEAAGVCTLTTWEQLSRKPLSHQGVDVSAPSMRVQDETYRCNEDGTRQT